MKKYSQNAAQNFICWPSGIDMVDITTCLDELMEAGVFMGGVSEMVGELIPAGG